ncbi:hypothetical protein CSC04_1881 [Enterobacter roggenkampii]|nr:hypothetical protein CSC04_1881 [Enterobacter roggenkampii]
MTRGIFLNNFRHLRVSWNGDSLISHRNKFTLGDAMKNGFLTDDR